MKYIKKLQNQDQWRQNDGIQIIKVTSDVDNENLLNHIKEVGELFNNPEDDQKSNEPTKFSSKMYKRKKHQVEKKVV